MTTFLDCWISVAGGLLPQAVAGQPELVESLPKPLEAGSFGFAATVGGEQQGRFSMLLDAALLDSPLVLRGLGPEVVSVMVNPLEDARACL